MSQEQTTARRSLAGRSSRRRTLAVVGIAGLSLVLFLAGALGVGRPPSPDQPGSPRVFGVRPPAGGGLAARIVSLQDRVRRVPKDSDGWAALGLAYVEQARVTVDPTYYAKAEGALQRSLSIDPRDNFAACTGMAALASARHEFSAAREWARRGLAINPSSPTLYGALGDAETQLGNYQEAFGAIQRMVDLVPDTASLARASYTWELRGDIDQARGLMQRALDDATTPADRGFARYHLGELAFNAGDPTAALEQYERGLTSDPSSVALLAGKAKAEAALGRTGAALSGYAEVVSRVPEPGYLVEYGELLQSLGRTAEAEEQYRLFGSVQKLLESNGVALDVDPALFQADHGDRRLALQYAEAGLRIRPFIEMDDAYAWALHVNGRHAEALGWSKKALALGTRNALFHFHAGMIQRSLGDAGAARGHLMQALEINPHFSPLLAPVARQALDQLAGDL
ncbi:MAG: tetratricopeptide repeat protein [Actinomycetota bacterium]|nr:tetratricopeptide repeat protein [Actinomycetota bacterium]